MKFKPQIRLPFNNVDEKQDLSKSPIVPPVLERLEERTLYSVDFLALPPFETSDESISDENLLDQFPLDNTIQTDSLSPVELVIIDSRVPEIDFLVDELKKQKDTGRKLQAHVIDKSEDGLQTISSILNGQLVSAIHVISHGSTSGFQLGSTWIDAENLNSYAQQLSGWKNSLTESADLLLYGCNLSTTNSGLHLSAQLGALTGADIASSSNTTGHSAIGGDWILEHHTGSIETQVVVNSAITAGWHHNLLAGTNGPDLLLGVDSANNELLGLAGNDLLIAGGDFLQFGGTHLGDFNFESNALEKNVGAGTTNSGLTINSGSVDFIPSGTYNLEVPGAARAILFQNAEVQTELAGTVPGVDYSIAFYIGGETGTHSADIKIVRSDGQSIGDSTLSFQVPGGVSYSNMIWQPIAMTFTAHSDPTTLIVKSTDGAPLMAAARVADHSSTAGSAITSIDGGTGNDTILYGAANDIVTDGAGSDIISSGNGDDEILDGPGSDIILGGRDNDKFLIFEDSPVDENQFWGGRGDDQYILKNNIHSEFTITDSIGSDAIVLQYDAAAGNANYFLPDTFSLELSGIESIKTEPAGTPDQILGDATYTNPLDWDLSFVTAIDGNISVQGGIQNDIFYNAFTGTEYRGGDGMDTVSVNALFSQIDVDRANYTGTNTSDDTQSIVITDTTQATLPTDTISDTVETLIFLDGTYDIASGNILPTLSLFSNFVATEDEDSQVLISLDRLKNQGNEEDLDGSVDAMVVQSVANGFLRIGPNAANASTWNPGVNDVIDANNNGYWIKDPAVDVNVSINLDAITVLARDNDEALSNTPIAVQVNLTPVNESLVFNNAIATTPENTPVTIVYNNDLESNWTFNKPGTFNGEPEIILVDSVVSGTLKINGVDFHPTNNYTITTSSALVWTPDLNTTTADDGIQYAFTVRVADANGNASSAAMAEITVTQDTINNLPELSVINSVVATTNEDTEVEITFAELTAAGNETDSDGTVTAMVVQAVPTGSLRIGPDDVSAVPYDAGNKDTIDAGNNAYWTPGMNAHGSLPAFSIVAKDNEGAISDVATAPTATVSVIPVNDAPAGADNTIVIDEDNAHTFSALDFGFTDTDNNVLDFVVIDTLPLSGALTLSNTAVTAGQAIPVSVLGALQFTPIAGENGTAYASFTFSVRDDGGTANSGIDTDTTANTITFDITSINDAPTGADNTIVIDEDNAHTFSALDFGFTDTDNNVLDFVVIDSLPLSGALTLSNTAVTAGQAIPVSVLGALKFTPIAGENGTAYSSLTFSVRDDGGTANGGIDTDTTANTITFDVTSINDAPTGTDNTIVIDEDASHSFAEIDFGFTDTDNNVLDFVVIDSLPLSGALTLSNTAVTAGQAIPVGVLGALQFTPIAGENGTAYASFTFSVRDNGGTANGGIDTDTTANTITFDLTSINDAPTGTDNTIVIDEDASHSFAEIDFGFTDADNNTFDSVIIDSLPLTGALTLSNTAVTAGQAIPVGVLGALKFTPLAGENGTAYASFTFSVRDNGGTANGGIDTDTTANTITFDVTSINDAPAGTDNTIVIDEDNAHTFSALDFGFTDTDNNVLDFVVIDSLPLSGALTLSNTAVTAGQAIPVSVLGALKFTPIAGENGTAYSSFTFSVRDDGGTANGGIDTDTTANTITFDVTSINDAPTGTDNTIVIDEDVSHSFAEIDFGFTDADNNTFGSVIIDSLPLTGSLTLSNVAVSAGQAIPVGALGTLKFTPLPGESGTAYASFTFSVQDDGGTANGGINTDAIANVITFDVTSINDAPAGTDNTVSTNEDTAYTYTEADFGFTDTDGHTLQFITIESLPGNGQLTLGGVAVTVNDTVARTVIGDLKYHPAGNSNGIPNDTFEFSVTDDGGTFNGGSDTDNTPNKLTIDVQSVNDAPHGTDKVISVFEDTPFTFGLADFGFYDLVEGNAPLNVIIHSLPVNGQLEFNSTLVTNGQAIPVGSINLLKFIPEQDVNRTGYDSFSFVVQDDGGTTNGGVDTDQNPNNININVISVNDPPTLTTFTNTTQHISIIDEDGVAEISLVQLLSNGDEADVDGTVDAMVVQSVSSGTLRIGIDQDSASSFIAGSNDTIDSDRNAYWAPAAHDNGSLTAFSVVARDNDSSESSTVIPLHVSVNDVNDQPTLGNPSANVDSIDEDAEAEITFSQLSDASNLDAIDIDGTVEAMVVTSVHSGTLRIGSDSTTANVFDAINNNTINQTKNSYWTPDSNAFGTLTAFSIAAKDDDGDTSDTTSSVVLSVNDVNDKPTLNSFIPYIDTTDEDRREEVALWELLQDGDSNDIDGNIVAMVVKSVESGSLTIGPNALTATPYNPSSNSIIDGSNTAFWLPAPNTNGLIQGFSVVAKDDDNETSDTPVPLTFLVNDINDPPVLSTFTTNTPYVDTVDEDNTVSITFSELIAEGDEADPNDSDGSIVAMRVTSIDSGTLTIGTEATSAGAFGPGNNIIDGFNHAFWTPDPDANGTQQAFSVVARDDDSADSTTSVPVSVLVNDINDLPTLTTFATPADSVDEDNSVEITLNELTLAGDQADPHDADGFIVAMRITSVNSGTLKIGSDAANASVFGSGNDIVDDENHAFWTPDPDSNGTIQAFSAVARDDDGADSPNAVAVSVLVNDVNDIPTLTAFTSPVDSVDEDNTAEITFDELTAIGDQADAQDTAGSIVAMRVTSVNSGTLKIGSDEASANVFGAGNNVIDGANHAFWTPDPDANGTIQSFSVVARDDDGADSATAVPVSVLVNDINDIPTLTTFASPIDNVDEDNTAEITFNQLINAGDQADTNDLTGSVVAMRIISVDSGTLKIGTSATSANAFGPGNDIIDDTNNAFWTPDPDTNGSIQAFSVVARDDDNADSRVATPVTVLVNDINDNPTLSTFSTNNLQIDSTEEDTVVEITLNKLIDEGDEQDIDGNVVAMVVNAVESGTLSIGLDAGTAAAFAPDSNDTIDISNNAYWIPDVNTNGIIAALSITAKDDDNATSAAVTASILVNAVNDPPVITDMGVGTTFEDTTLTLDLARMHTLVQTDDVDGSVTAYKIVNVGNGTLKIGNSESEASPYIADVNDTIGSNQIAYWTPDENANTITSGLQGDLAIVAIDDLGTSSVNNGLLMIDTISINDPPDGADTTIPILEDTAYTIRAGDFGYNDIDNNNFESVIITELPAGMLTSSGIQVQVGTSLSFSEIVNGQLVFLPDADSFGNTNSIGFKVQDDGGTVAGGIATDPVSNHILFDTSPLNDSPLIFTEPVQLIEGGLIEIDESYIRALDVDDDPTDLVHTIQSLPQHGQLLLNGLSAEIGTAFTQQQIIDHELSYQHDGSESQSDSFSVQLIDGGEDGSEAVTALIDILITEVNDAPTLGSYRLPVDNTDEDTPVEITLAELNAQGNSGDIDGNVVALLVKSVETGSLRIGLDAQNAAAYHPINNNLINAAHNAYWTPDLNANTDINDEQKSFTVKAQDDDGALSPHTASVSVIVNDINDAPVITNIDVASTLEDTPLTLDLDTLQSLVTVNDIDGNVVSYKILSVGNGTLSIGTTVETATPFTIGSNDTISVTESGYWSPATNENSDVHGLLAALTVAAIDNDGTSSNHHTLLVNTISVNDAPMGEDNSLPLMEDHTHQFDVEDFGFSDVDNDTFTSVIITELPVPGLLLLSGAQVPVDSEIPYSDIYNGLLTFTPAANFNGNLTSGIGFRVVDDGGTLHTGTAIDPSPNTLQISTTPVNDAPQFYSQNLLLDEGATVSVDASVMNAQDPDNSPADLIYTLVSPPQHGELFLHDAALQTGNQFTQQHVIDKSLTFTHDGSETSADEFSIELADGSDDNAPGIQGTVSMEISEIIDAAPTVDDRDLVVEFSAGIDSSKDDLELPLLEGQNEEVTIQLVTGPMHGTVALKADGNFAYQHDGSLFLTDQFTFRVTNSDGVYTDATVNLTIEPPVAAAFDTPVPELVDQSPEIEALPKSNTEQEAPERQTDNTQEETLFSKSEATPEAMKQRTPDSPVPVEFARNDTSVNSLINSFEDRIQLHRKWQLSDSSTDIQSDVVQLNQQTDSELSLDALFGIDSEFLSHRGNKIAENLDEQRELLQDAKSADLELISRSVTVTSTISIGYIIWLVRGGLLLGSVLSSLPAWRSFDPLPVLTSLGGDNDDDTETLESMVKEDKNATADKRVKKG